MTKNQRNLLIITIVVLLLLGFIFMYFRNRKRSNGEKCPDGRDIPTSGNCADNPPLFDSQGNAIVTPTLTDANGCTAPSSYVVNAFPLTVGMQGSLVKQLQMHLNTSFRSIGSPQISEDGYFGCKTLDSLIKAYNIRTVDAEFFKNNIQLTPIQGLQQQTIYETPTL